MRSSFQVFILFIVRCHTDDSTDNSLSNLIHIDNDQAGSPLPSQLIASTNNPVDSPTVSDPFVNTDNSGALTGSATSLDLLVNTYDQVESAASQNVALVPTVAEVPAEIRDPTLDNTNDRSSHPAASSKLIPSNGVAFDWRSPPIDCKPPFLIACCTMDGKMRICEECFDRLSEGCKRATLHCCRSIDEDFQCVDEQKIEQNEGVDSVEQVGAGVVGRGDMTEAEWEIYKKHREQALQRKREAAERKAREDELRKQQEFYQEEGDKVRNDAKQDSDWGIRLPDWLLGIPGSRQDSIWQLGN